MVAKWINNFVNSILSPDLDQRFVVSCSFVMVCPHSSASLTAHFYLICGLSSIKLQFCAPGTGTYDRALYLLRLLSDM